MVSGREFIEFAAGILGVPAETLSFETTYQSIPEWDSIAQLRLVTEVAAKFGVEIPFAEVTNVTSLWEFWRRINGGAVKKVVAVDLDNTLWDGVVGEDGVEGIRPKVEFQLELKALKERGVLLVALSKNNFEDVEWMLGDESIVSRGSSESRCSSASRMVLSRDDFVSWRVNWQPKAENLLEVARELNLSVDAFVFVDDNPVERLEMTVRLPEVTVAEFPPKLEAYFPKRELTDEDRHKTEEYRAEAKRRECLSRLAISDIWQELGIELDVHVMTDDEVARVAQLSQKANQFDVCTNRYSEAEIRELGQTGLVVTAHAKDRFGDQGLIAFVIVKGDEILDWVMSCRVTGRGIEEKVETEVERLAAARGVSELSATWRDSGKNAPVKDLFERFGFESTEETQNLKKYVKRSVQFMV